MSDLVKEKIRQAVGILNELNIDTWLTLVRETTETSDPVFPFTVDSDVVWESAFIISRDGGTTAIVGSLDAAAVRERGQYSRVLSYDADMGPGLRQVLDAARPASIAVNYSKYNNTADGLSHGLYLYLTEDLLKGTDYPKRLVSADGIISRLRGLKSPGELTKIGQAIDVTEAILKKVAGSIRPGVTEDGVYRAIRLELAAGGHADAWSPTSNPGVDIGEGAHRGHGGPGQHAAQPGDILHVDFGARVDGYSADLQRVYYFRGTSESGIPEDVQKAFAAVRGALLAGAKALKPGVEGWRVDDAARTYLTSVGYPEYPHALGHNLGRMAHDGGGILGPRWPRYGDRPYVVVEPGNVFTLELGTKTSRGYIGLEEDVVVTETGCEFLSKPQTEISIIPWGD